MCVKLVRATILASTALVVTTAIGCQDSGVNSNGYESLQKAGEAFIVAMTKKDWKTGFRCFTPEAQDLAIAHLITMTRYVAVLGKKEQEVKTLFREAWLSIRERQRDHAGHTTVRKGEAGRTGLQERGQSFRGSDR